MLLEVVHRGIAERMQNLGETRRGGVKFTSSLVKRPDRPVHHPDVANEGENVAGNREAIRGLFEVTPVSTGNMPTLPEIFPDSIARADLSCARRRLFLGLDDGGLSDCKRPNRNYL